MNMQGIKEASRDFYELIKSVFATIGLFPTSIDNGFFVGLYQQKSIVLLCLSTDDYILGCQDKTIHAYVNNAIKKAFNITSQTGHIIHYLNYQIIQTPGGISVDQTEHIINMLQQRSQQKLIIKYNTPLQTNKEFDIALSTSIPSTEDKLNSLQREYGGSYLTLYGKLLHIATCSRPDITHAIHCLGAFQQAPLPIGFTALYRVFGYLQKYPHVPIFYPKLPLTHRTVFKSILHSNQQITIPHVLCGFSDNASGPVHSLHQIDGCCKLLGSTVIDWKTSKNDSCGTSMTDNEIRALFRAAKRCRKSRVFLQQIGIHLPKPTILYNDIHSKLAEPTIIFEDNKGACDCIQAHRVTTNLRHIEIPLRYLHELQDLEVLKFQHCPGPIMFADILTKSLTGPKHHEGLQRLIGYIHYPDTTIYIQVYTNFFVFQTTGGCWYGTRHFSHGYFQMYPLTTNILNIPYVSYLQEFPPIVKLACIVAIY